MLLLEGIEDQNWWIVWFLLNSKIAQRKLIDVKEEKSAEICVQKKS
jgi:hypothetical protein